MSTTEVLAKLVAAHNGVIAARAEVARHQEARRNAIADARMAGVPVKSIAERLVGEESLSPARVQQLALKVLAERGDKAPRGKGEAMVPTKAPAATVLPKKAPAKAAQPKVTPIPKVAPKRVRKAATKARVRPGTMTGDATPAA